MIAKQKQLTLVLEHLKTSKEQLFEQFADGKLTKEQYIRAKDEQTDNISKAEKEIEDISVAISDIILLGKEDTG